jgi:hypothetical protein
LFNTTIPKMEFDGTRLSAVASRGQGTSAEDGVTLMSSMMIHTLLEACEVVLYEQGEPRSSFWLASQVVEMKLWRASGADVRGALCQHIAKHCETSRFVTLPDDEWGLRSWAAE